MRIMGIDFGEARIGIALSDPTGTLATPNTVLHEKDKGRQISRVVELITDYDVTKVVVGIPYQLDGSEGPMAQMAAKYAEKLGRVSGVDVVAFDERLTSMQAERLLKAGGKKGKKRRIKDSIDMAAAAVILQAYLDSPRIL